MPDESCRKCGGLLLDYTICAKCRAPIQFICRICATRTMERFHMQICFKYDETPSVYLESNHATKRNVLPYNLNQNTHLN